jgi:integrase/recombinase XerD
LLPYRPGRAHPYLYSKDEVRELLRAAQRLPSTHGLRPTRRGGIVFWLDWPTTFFVSGLGTRLDGAEIRRTFYFLSRQIGLRGPTDSHGPRLHDFRHRFAVEALVQWYRSGQDVERRLPILTTFLGHVHVADTYWYLSACPELMGLAVKRFEDYWEKQS